MAVKKDRNYRSISPIIQLEQAPNHDDATAAVGYINTMSLDNEDRKMLFQALGYAPYMGKNTNHAKKYVDAVREPVWEIARKVLSKNVA